MFASEDFGRVHHYEEKDYPSDEDEVGKINAITERSRTKE